MPTVEVRSDRNPDVVYEVDVEAGTCTCPAYTQRLAKLNAEDSGHRECKHLIRVRQQVQDEGK